MFEVGDLVRIRDNEALSQVYEITQYLTIGEQKNRYVLRDDSSTFGVFTIHQSHSDQLILVCKRNHRLDLKNTI